MYQVSWQEEATELEKYYYSSAQLSKFPILSFFSGAGFLDIGFLKSGFDIIWRNEFNISFVKGFEYAMAHMRYFDYYGNKNVHNNTSIIGLTSSGIAQEAFHNLPRPETFGIIGGPPCPDFSTGGSNRGREGDQGKLTGIYIDIISKLQPTFFLLENVPGLLRTQKHRYFLYELLCQLHENYFIDFTILNALEYGVPQDRERLFLVGFSKQWVKRNKGEYFFHLCENQNVVPLLQEKQYQSCITALKTKHWFPWPTGCYQLAKTRYRWPEQSPFGMDIEKPSGIPDELMIGSYISSPEELSNVPNGTEAFNPKSSKFTAIDEGDVSRKSFKRLHRWRYSPAAAYGNNEVHLHPTEARRLTVREAFRIQSVPDTYIFPTDLPLSHKFKMIGNGVPIKLAQEVSAAFVAVLENSNNVDMV